MRADSRNAATKLNLMQCLKNSRSTARDVEVAVIDLRSQELLCRPGEYTTVLSALGRKRQWGVALQLLQEMRRSRLEPNVISYSSAISVCECCYRRCGAPGLSRT